MSEIPRSEVMERSVLACILDNSSEALPFCVTAIKCGPEAFYDIRNQLIYATMVDMGAEQQPVNPVTLFQRLSENSLVNKVGGMEYLLSIPDSAPASESSLKHYVEKVLSYWIARKAMATISELTDNLDANPGDGKLLLKTASEAFIELVDANAGEKVMDAESACSLLTDDLERRFNLQGQKSGIVTGLHRLDSITDGLQYCEQTIIGARPSQGKSALATTIIDRACLCDKVPTLVVTLEMSIPALCRRLIANHNRVPMGVLRSGLFTEGDKQRIASFSVLLKQSPLYFIDGIDGTDSDTVCQSIKWHTKRFGVRLVVIDYLQKIHPSKRHEKRTYEVAEVSGALKAVAVHTGVAMVTLAQLNREPDKDKGRQPRLSDLADSGQIERDGDCIILLDRKRDQDNGRQATLFVAKQRDGEVGAVSVIFDGQFCRFDNAPI